MGIKQVLISTMVLVVSSCQFTFSSKDENKYIDTCVVVEDSITTSLLLVEEAEMPNRTEKPVIGEAQVFELVNYVKSEYVSEERAHIFMYDTMNVALKVKSNLDSINREKPGFHNLVLACDSASKPRSYSLDDSFDMGDFDLWFFRSEESNVIIVELYDYYGSVFFPYVLVDEKLFIIGDFEIMEPEVEDVGIQKKDIKVVWDGEKFITTTFLGGVEDGVFKFDWADAVEQIKLD